MFTRKLLLDITNNLASIKDELDEHLDTINENSREIDENRVMISSLHEQLCKLTDVVNELSFSGEDRMQAKIELSRSEQIVFEALYTEPGPMTYGFLARRSGKPVSVVRDIVFELVKKGVPVVKLRDELGAYHLALDMEFRELQARQQIVQIESQCKTITQSSLIE